MRGGGGLQREGGGLQRGRGRQAGARRAPGRGVTRPARGAPRPGPFRAPALLQTRAQDTRGALGPEGPPDQVALRGRRRASSEPPRPGSPLRAPKPRGPSPGPARLPPAHPRAPLQGREAGPETRPGASRGGTCPARAADQSPAPPGPWGGSPEEERAGPVPSSK